MFLLPSEGTTSSLMNWVGFCASMQVIEQIVNSVNNEMERKKKSINIINCRDIIFSLKWNEEEQRYFTIAIINNNKVEGVSGKVCAEFDEAFYMQMYIPLKTLIPNDWEKKLNKTVLWELLGEKINIDKTWYGKVRPTVISLKSPIMKYFHLNLCEKVFNGSKETLIEITPMIDSILSSWVVWSIVESQLKNVYESRSITVRIENCRYSEVNTNYYKRVISDTITQQIKQLVKTQVL